jgi:hypothetical protein
LFAQLLRRHDLPPIGLHAFGRHGAVTNAVRGRMDTEFVRRLTGHATDQMVRTYLHLGVADRRVVSEALERAYARLRDELQDRHHLTRTPH